MTECVIYCRISRDITGKAAGIERQETACRELATNLGLQVARVFTDNDISAYSGKPRPGFEAMIDYIEHSEVHHIPAWHIDRLYRRVAELNRITSLVRDHTITIQTVKAGELDLSTAQGILNAEIAASVAGYEVRHQIERQKASHVSRAAKGTWRGGVPPYGLRTTSEKGVLELDPVAAKHVRTAAQMVLEGRTLMSICRVLDEAGAVPPSNRATAGRPNRKWRAKIIRGILKTPTIAGLSHRNGEIVGKAAWPAVIDETTWRSVCHILDDPTRVTHAPEPRKWQGSGVYYCGKCGSKLSTGKSKANGGKVRAYNCKNCYGITRRVDLVDQVVDAVILGYLDMPENRLKIMGSQESKESVDIEALMNEKLELSERNNQLATMFTDGEITAKQLAAGTERVKVRVAEIDRKLSAARAVSTLADLVLSGEQLKERWNDMPAEVRGNVIAELVKVTIMPAKSFKFDPQNVRFEWL